MGLHSNGRLLAVPTNIRLGWEWLIKLQCCSFNPFDNLANLILRLAILQSLGALAPHPSPSLFTDYLVLLTQAPSLAPTTTLLSQTTCGLYYKHITIVIDTASVVSK